MKKRKILILIIVVLVLLIAAAITALVICAPMLSMKPVKTGQIEDTGVSAIENMRNNIYVIGAADGYILIDAGSDSKTVIDSINELGISPDDVKYVFLTHTDYDHVATLGKLKNATVYMGEDEKQMIDGTTKRNITGRNSLPDGTPDNNFVSDGDTVKICEHTVKCISAPGHTTGSTVYMLDEKYLFTGDAFSVSDGAISVHPFTMDSFTAEKSIEKLSDFIKDSEIVFTAHYGYFYSDTITR